MMDCDEKQRGPSLSDSPHWDNDRSVSTAAWLACAHNRYRSLTSRVHLSESTLSHTAHTCRPTSAQTCTAPNRCTPPGCDAGSSPDMRWCPSAVGKDLRLQRCSQPLCGQ